MSECKPPDREKLKDKNSLEYKTEKAFRDIHEIIIEQARVCSYWRNLYTLDLKDGNFESFEDIATFVNNASKAILKPLESIPDVWLAAFEDEEVRK